MSGHSKWATIKRQKGANDAKRGQLFTKLSNAITIAVREGAGITDPNSNFKLRLAIDKARDANMPKGNIERSIDRALGSGVDSLIEVTYEGFAPGGIAVIVQAVTDNKARTVSEIKNIFEKQGGSMGGPGSVSYLFTQKGELVVPKNGKSSDELLSIALDNGVEDMDDEEKHVTFYTTPHNLSEVKRGLENSGLSVTSAELVYKPISYATISDKTIEGKVLTLLEKMEDQQDVQKVFTNVEFS